MRMQFAELAKPDMRFFRREEEYIKRPFTYTPNLPLETLATFEQAEAFIYKVAQPNSLLLASAFKKV
jgi:hypothetical protein